VSFDALYETAPTFDAVYEGIVAQLLEAVNGRERVVYAVPGHPLCGERPTRLLLERAPKAGVEVEICPGLSFVDSVATALHVDPVLDGLQVVDGLELAYRSGPNGFNTLPLPVSGLIAPYKPVLVAQMYSAEVAGPIKITLAELYPDTWPVKLVRYDQWHRAHQVTELPLSEIDRGPIIDHLTSLYVPPLAPLQATTTFDTLAHVIWRLRAPGGCPWDREQTNESIKGYFVEETYEAIDALERQDWDGFVEELGDVLLQVVLHSQIASEEGLFDITSVLRRVSEKLIRRHPHVFGSVDLKTSSEVLRNWEAIKAAERGDKPVSPFEDIPTGMPALAYANELLRRARKWGFEWPGVTQAFAKVKEELAELEGASEAGRAEEFGDLLLALVKLAQWLGLDPEEALRAANRKLKARLMALEGELKSRGLSPREAPPDVIRQIWEGIKAS
jgi:tetrapyrrole methylase family protein/MazG family protein